MCTVCQCIEIEKIPVLTVFFSDLSLKFIYSEKATKFCEISTVDLTGTTLTCQIIVQQILLFFGEKHTYTGCTKQRGPVQTSADQRGLAQTSADQ